MASLERWHEARDLGIRCLAEADRAGLCGMRHYIALPLGLVEAKLGDHDGARARIDAVIAAREADGYEGMTLGWAYEARARLALWKHDEASFEKYAMLCRQQYKKTGGNPALAAKYERLMQEARALGAVASGELSETLSGTVSLSSIHTTIERDRELKRELRACRDSKERARVALELLLERARSRVGELYLVHADGLELAASTLPAADPISAALAQRLVEPSTEVTDIGSVCTVHDVSANARVPLLLSYRYRGAAWLVGVAVLRDELDGAAGSPLEAAHAIARVLAELEDIEPRRMSLPPRDG